MKKEKLYLICPDCHIEQLIRQRFGSDAYFLTALGAVFDMSEFEYAEEMNQFIKNESISEIVIVNDLQCTFICNTVGGVKSFDTKAEKELENLLNINRSSFNSLQLIEQKRLLAKLNIYRQASNLLDVAFIGNKISDEKIKVSGLIYDRMNLDFNQLEL